MKEISEFGAIQYIVLPVKMDISKACRTAGVFMWLQSESLAVHGTDTYGGKHSKEQVTAVLCCSMMGEFLKTV